MMMIVVIIVVNIFSFLNRYVAIRIIYFFAQLETLIYLLMNQKRQFQEILN